MSTLREALMEVRQEYGQLTPELVVEAARPADHPLHDRFEWDDAIAGEAWRRQQAHRLIQSVRLSYRSSNGPRSVRALVAVPRPDHPAPVYEPVHDVMADPMRRTILLQDMEREWRTLKERYGHMVEFAEMIKNDAAAA